MVLASCLDRREGISLRRQVRQKSTQQIWTLRSGMPVAITVTVGATDGQFTEVTSTDLREGMQVITNSAAVAK